MEVEDNSGFKHVSNPVKNTYTMKTKSFIQVTQDKTAQIFTIKILIMRSIWYAYILVIIASKHLYQTKLEMDIYQYLGIKESWQSLLQIPFSFYSSFFVFTLSKLRLVGLKQVKILKSFCSRYLLGSFTFSFFFKLYILFTI